MKEIIETLGALQNTSIPVIMVVGGILFLLLGIAGGFTGKIEIPRNRQKWAIIIGCVMLIFGTVLSMPNSNKSKVSASEKERKVSSKTSKTQTVDLYFETKNDLFYIGEEIKLYFKAPSSFHEKAWVGIIPYYIKHGSENENDKYDLDFKYLNKQTSGVLVFKAPNKPGAYDFRMHDINKDGLEVAFLTFIVSIPPISETIYTDAIHVKGADGISIRTKTLSNTELNQIQNKKINDISYMTTLKNGTEVQIINRGKLWHYVKAKYNEQNRIITGYICAKFDGKKTVEPL